MKHPSPPPAVAVPDPAETHPATREGVLDAAERLFSQKGIEGTSVRQIIQAAGVNLGAINYHFGSKDRLALEVFARRLKPVNRERIARLNVLEAGPKSRRISLEAILEALIRPALESGEDQAPNCMRLISRCFQEPNPEVKKFVEQQFSEVSRRFDSAILRAVPGLPPDELYWRINFLFGALHHGQEMWLRFDYTPKPSGVSPRKLTREELIQRVISFVSAGLAAPPPPKSTRPRPPAGAQRRRTLRKIPL